MKRLVLLILLIIPVEVDAQIIFGRDTNGTWTCAATESGKTCEFRNSKGVLLHSEDFETVINTDVSNGTWTCTPTGSGKTCEFRDSAGTLLETEEFDDNTDASNGTWTCAPTGSGKSCEFRDSAGTLLETEEFDDNTDASNGTWTCAPTGSGKTCEFRDSAGTLLETEEFDDNTDASNGTWTCTPTGSGKTCEFRDSAGSLLETEDFDDETTTALSDNADGTADYTNETGATFPVVTYIPKYTVGDGSPIVNDIPCNVLDGRYGDSYTDQIQNKEWQCLIRSGSPVWKQTSGDFYVEDYRYSGATDNAVIDSTRFAGGAGATIVLESGREYELVRRVDITHINQTWDLNEATITMQDEIVHSIIGSVVNVHTLDSVAGLEVGMEFTFSTTDGYDGTSIGGPFSITSIDGLEVTASNSANPISFPATFSTQTNFIDVLADGTEIMNGVFDGNMDNNDTIARWDASTMVHIHGQTFFHDNYLLNHAGEFVAPSNNSGGTVIKNNVFTNNLGSAVHFGRSIDERPIYIEDNHFFNTALDNDRLGHADATLEWSLYTTLVVVRNNYASGSPEAFIDYGAGSPAGSMGMTVYGNYVENYEDGFLDYNKGNDWGLGRETWSYVSEPERSKIIVRDNVMSNTGQSNIETSAAGTTDEAGHNVSWVDNQMYNSSLLIAQMDSVEVANNLIVIEDEMLSGIDTTASYSFYHGVVTFRANGSIYNNKIYGGTFSIRWANYFRIFPVFGIAENEMSITDNLLANFTRAGLYADQPTLRDSVSLITFSNNIVSSDVQDTVSPVSVGLGQTSVTISTRQTFDNNYIASYDRTNTLNNSPLRVSASPSQYPPNGGTYSNNYVAGDYVYWANGSTGGNVVNNNTISNSAGNVNQLNGVVTRGGTIADNTFTDDPEIRFFTTPRLPIVPAPMIPLTYN